MLEEPMVRKCCKCVPLKVCLQIWAWFKVIADILSSLYIFAGLLLYNMTHDYDVHYKHYSHELVFIMILVLLILDLVFVTVLIAGIFKKKYLYIRIFFFYGVFMILTEAVLSIVFLVLLWKVLWLNSLIFIIFGILWIALDICVLLTLKSEMIKIRNKEQYDFLRIMNSGLAQDNIRPQEKYVEKVFVEDGLKKQEYVGEKYLKLLDCN